MKIFIYLMSIVATFLMLGSCSDNNQSPLDKGEHITLSTNTIQMDKNGGEATIKVSSSGDWRISGSCDWAEPLATSGKNGDEVTFRIASGTTEKRTTTFKFFTGASVAILKIECEPNYAISLLSDENLSVGTGKNTIQVQLNTNVAEPVVTPSDEWITYSLKNNFDGKLIMLFNVEENLSYKERSGSITISSPLVETPVVVNLMQKQTDAILLEQSSLIYDLNARQVSFTISANVEYNVSVSEGNDWITGQNMSSPIEKENGLSVVTITYNLSQAENIRGGLINISSEYGLSNELAIIQKTDDVTMGEIKDKALQNISVANQWATHLVGNQYGILQAGKEATTLASSYSNKIADLSGVENFPNLTTLALLYCDQMRVMDISQLHKVTKLTYSNTINCETFNLGDNPIEELSNPRFTYSGVEKIAIISSKLKTLNFDVTPAFSKRNDAVTTIDVSECPSLVTLSVNRGDKLKTLILKKGQVIPNITKGDGVEIVYKD